MLQTRMLDLFSGSGALGIEALSRGAAHVTFVDRSIFCIQAIQANLEALSLKTLVPSPFTLIRAEVLTGIRKVGREGLLFDLILLDPPYGRDLARKSLIEICRCAIVAARGLVVVEHAKRDRFPPQVEGKEMTLVLCRQQQYGDTALTFYERQ